MLFLSLESPTDDTEAVRSTPRYSDDLFTQPEQDI